MKRVVSLTLALVMIFSMFSAIPVVSQAAEALVVKLSNTTYTYNGFAKTPGVTVTYNNKVLKKSTDYTVKYAAGRVNVGKYKVRVVLKGNYSGAKNAYFKIVPAATTITSLKSTQNSFTVNWKVSTKQVEGYKIEYSKNADFSNSKTVIIRKNTTGSYTVKNLSANTKYYVRVKTYFKTDEKTFFSAWSKAAAVTTQKAVSTPTPPVTKPSVSSTVYITPYGKKYHVRKTCAGKNAIATTVPSAKQKGYDPCKKCVK